MTKILFNIFLTTLAGSFVLAEKFTVAEINFITRWLEIIEPSNNMRKAQFGTSGPWMKSTELFYYFGSGNTGGIQANVDRWMKQFEEPLGKKVDTLTIKTRVTYAQAHGTL